MPSLSRLSCRRIFQLLTATICLLLANTAFATKEMVLHAFTDNPDGADPTYGLIFAPSGGPSDDLYGTTPNGGTQFSGDVFELAPNGSGGWTYNVIYTFTDCRVACYPAGPLATDGTNLYGASSIGGVHNNGAIFEMTRGSDGTWSVQTIYSFENKPDGQNPNGVVYYKGNLYGTTANGGKYEGGTVFALTSSGDGTWSENVIHHFEENDTDGNGPMGGVVFDAKGNLYGMTSMGGPNQAGTVFELTLTSGGLWQEHILHSFDVTDGLMPWYATPIFDKQGNLYGTTSLGGSGQYGTVFELTRSGAEWTETVLYNFAGGEDGANPNSGVSIDSEGRLYGATVLGGGRGDCTDQSTQNLYCGTVFLLTPSQSGPWAISYLHRFADSTDGAEPSAGVILDSRDNVYGVTSHSGTASGVVFELSHPPR